MDYAAWGAIHGLATAQVGTIRLRLLKIGARFALPFRKVWVRMASSYPFRALSPRFSSNSTVNRGAAVAAPILITRCKLRPPRDSCVHIHLSVAFSLHSGLIDPPSNQATARCEKCGLVGLDACAITSFATPARATMDSIPPSSS